MLRVPAGSMRLNVNDLLFFQQPLIPQPQKDLRYRDHIPFAIMDDPLKIILFIVHVPDHAPINVLFRRWYTQHMGHEFQGGVVFEIPEFPEV